MRSIVIKNHFILVFALLLPFTCISNQAKDSLDWLIVYYLPYDNNLSLFADGIVEEVKSGITSDKIVVAMQIDRQDSLGCKRYIVTKKGIEQSHINEEYSANTATFKDFIQWATHLQPYKRVALHILDHGGQLDQVCLDEYPNKGQFLRVDSIALVLSEDLPMLDLLFMQVCAKSSIEPLYELAPYAQYILASQFPLPAPNHYYKEAFSQLSENSSMNGREWAKNIMHAETEDMFTSYTCISSKKLQAFVAQFKAFYRQLPKSAFDYQDMPDYVLYADEQYWDLQSWLANLSLDGDLDKERHRLNQFVSSEVILEYRTQITTHTGLSIFANILSQRQYTHLSFFK